MNDNHREPIAREEVRDFAGFVILIVFILTPLSAFIQDAGRHGL